MLESTFKLMYTVFLYFAISKNNTHHETLICYFFSRPIYFANKKVKHVQVFNFGIAILLLSNRMYVTIKTKTMSKQLVFKNKK